MIAVDTNILVYAHRGDSRFHRSASEAIKGLAEGNRAWAIPWPCIHEFLAVVTHPRIYDPPTPLARALSQVDAWLASPSLRVLSEGPRHWETLKEQAAAGTISGAAVHDARVAAICIDAGVKELWSADRDFHRLRLRIRNPLE
ncbi:MAG: type II toxin-antitoxin system VapC family toxin [Acidimicrobiia bacterium]